MAKLIKRTRTVNGKEITPGMDKGVKTYLGDAQKNKYGRIKTPRAPRQKVFDGILLEFLDENDNHFRVNGSIDFYQKGKRFHVLETGERGDFDNWFETTLKYIKVRGRNA